MLITVRFFTVNIGVTKPSIDRGRT